jgi:hypothetical protein
MWLIRNTMKRPRYTYGAPPLFFAMMGRSVKERLNGRPPPGIPDR